MVGGEDVVGVRVRGGGGGERGTIDYSCHTG